MASRKCSATCAAGVSLENVFDTHTHTQRHTCKQVGAGASRNASGNRSVYILAFPRRFRVQSDDINGEQSAQLIELIQTQFPKVSSTGWLRLVGALKL